MVTIPACEEPDADYGLWICMTRLPISDVMLNPPELRVHESRTFHDFYEGGALESKRMVSCLPGNIGTTRRKSCNQALNKLNPMRESEVTRGRSTQS